MQILSGSTEYIKRLRQSMNCAQPQWMKDGARLSWKRSVQQQDSGGRKLSCYLVSSRFVGISHGRSKELH